MGDPAMAAIVERMRGQADDVAHRTVERYRREIADYAASTGTLIEGEVLSVTRRSLDLLIDELCDQAPPADDRLEEIRRSLGRRVNQGVSLMSIQYACRIACESFWETILSCASLDVPQEREAALRAAATLMRHTSLIAGAGAQAYLDAMDDVRDDGHIVRRHLLDAVLAGRSATPATVRDARLLGIELHPEYLVLVARPAEPEDEADPDRTSRATLRRVGTVLREELRSEEGPPLVGVREGEVVCLYPASSPAAMEPVKAAAHSAAASLTDLGISVGIGSWHATPAGVPTAYAEAREAAASAARAGIRDRAVVFDDVLIDHVLRSNEHAERMIGDALGPLREYDELRNANLVETLRSYVDTGLSVARSAEALSVHANTVTYRLGRIQQLTGRDPRQTGDLLFLALSLRLETGAAL